MDHKTRYIKDIKKYGYSFKSLDYSCEYALITKMQVLIEYMMSTIITKNNQPNILDLGCGLCHVKELLGNKITYTGLDPIVSATYDLLMKVSRFKSDLFIDCLDAINKGPYLYRMIESPLEDFCLMKLPKKKRYDMTILSGVIQDLSIPLDWINSLIKNCSYISRYTYIVYIDPEKRTEYRNQTNTAICAKDLLGIIHSNSALMCEVDRLSLPGHVIFKIKWN